MGYTHYWETDQPIEDDQWNLIAKEAMMVARKSSAVIQYDWDDDALPCFDSNKIQFNGVGDDGHETFYLNSDPVSFDCCKTAVKPYDVIVVAILIIAKYHLGSDFSWSSDGEIEELQDSVELLNSCGLNYGVNMQGMDDDCPLLDHCETS